jgi:hypothetical protein
MFLDRILGVDTRGQVPDDFGVKLTAANIDAHLSSINRGHQAYVAAHTEEVQEIEAVLQSSGRLRPQAR